MARLWMLVVVFLCVSVEAREALRPSAERFVEHGGVHVLRMCNIPKRTCFGRPLVVEIAERGSSNDEERQVETLAQSGIKTEVVFPLTNRRAYHLGSVEVTSSQWISLFGIAPGSKRDAVLGKLGKPNGSSPEHCDQYFSEAIESSAVVCYQGGRISRIRWEYFID